MSEPDADTMSYEEAVDRITDREPPEFWIGNENALRDQLASLERGQVEEIGTSPGGRPFHLVSYGQAEPPEQRANFNSAVAARDPTDYVDRDEREQPVVLLVGPVHGHEVEGLTGLCNLLSVVETGTDLAGQERPTLRELATSCRLLVLPCGNPDGLARFEPESLNGATLADLEFWGQGTWADDRLIGWPDAKQQHPMTGENVGSLGCYFDDDGVNPMHDEFFDPMGPEAPAILDVVRQEAPDIAVSLHSHAYPPGFHRPAYVPLEHQSRVRSMHREYNQLLSNRGLPTYAPIEVAAESGTPKPFNLVSAMYHVSGTTAAVHECPHGLSDGHTDGLDHTDILEAQFSLYECILREALESH